MKLTATRILQANGQTITHTLTGQWDEQGLVNPTGLLAPNKIPLTEAALIRERAFALFLAISEASAK